MWETEGEWSDRKGKNELRVRKDIRLPTGQKISIEMEGSAVLSGDEICCQLCGVAAVWKVDLPDASWDDILDKECMTVIVVKPLALNTCKTLLTISAHSSSITSID